jgi:hypothetical protein
MKLPQQGRLLLYQPQKSPVQNFFLFEIVKNNCQIVNKLARSNYSFKKRQKELARKKKKEQKRQRKLDKATNIPD